MAKPIQYCKVISLQLKLKNLNKKRNSIDLTEAEDIKRRWQEYTEELYKNIIMIQITTMVLPSVRHPGI